ncbi:MAG: hypothetical protein HUU01_03515 [Saprospiraceae bacterium]|nr:hypothetical protein [Saprospiraceae bacterium]
MSKLELLIPLFAVIGNFGAIIIFIYFYFTSRHRERMALIESGRDASIFKRDKDPSTRALKYGIMTVMAGLGLIVGSILDRLGVPEEIAYFAMVLIFAGMGLLAYYFLLKSRRESSSDIL